MPENTVTVAAEDVVFGLCDRERAPTAEAAFQLALPLLDFSWLSAGDSVFIKLALNSGFPHPAVTSSAAIRGMVAELYARGAGRVLVGDQAGSDRSRFANDGPQGRFLSTRQHAQESGVLRVIEDSGAEPHFFDEHGYVDGYFHPTLPPNSHWREGLQMARIAREVDHIVYLPRLGAHMVTGCTFGLKIAVGWLRDDSRHNLHYDAESLYEKYAEINYVAEIRERLRLTVTLVEKVMLHTGPDEGTIHVADPCFVIASQNLANHEALATSVFAYFNDTVPKTQTFQLEYPRGGGQTAPYLNRLLVDEWVPNATKIPWTSNAARRSDFRPHQFEQNVSNTRPLARAWELEGGRPAQIRVHLPGAQPDARWRDFVASHGEGIYQFVE